MSVKDSLSPRSQAEPQIRFQPSMLSVPSAANSVSPESRAPSQKQPNRPPRRGRLWALIGVSAVLGIGTAATLRDARVVGRIQSGSAGFKKSSTGQNLHWAKGGVTVYVDESVAKSGTGADEAVIQAFGSWVAGEQRLPNLSFDTVKGAAAPRQDGRSVVSYANITAPGHERDVALTYTYSDDKTGEIVEADIVINALYQEAVLKATSATSNDSLPTPQSQAGEDGAKVTQSRKSTHQYESVDCRDRYDVQNVVTHEAGHFFGLGEDMTDSAATMFYSIDECETHKRLPKADDLATMSQLYAATADPEEEAATQTGVRGCSVVGATSAGPSSWWLLVSALVPVLRRKRRR